MRTILILLLAGTLAHAQKVDQVSGGSGSGGAHASTHSDGGADEIVVTNLASACADAEVLGGDGAGGVECQSDGGSGSADFQGDFSSPSELTISSGSITISASGAYDVDTESDAASDDLTAMTCTAGVSFALRAESDARSVVLKSASFQVVGATDQTLDQDGDIALGFCAATDTPVIYAFSDESGQLVMSSVQTTGTGPLELVGITSPGANATSGTCNLYVDSADDLLKIHCNGGSEETYARLSDLDTFAEVQALVADKTLVNTADAATITGDYDLGGGTLQVPNSTSLPGTCDVGDAYMDTDATSGSRWYLCESANTWAAQGGGGSSCGYRTIHVQLGIEATTGASLSAHGAGGFSGNFSNVWARGSSTNTGDTWAGPNFSGTTSDPDSFLGRLIYIDEAYDATCGTIIMHGIGVTPGSGGGANVVLTARLGNIEATVDTVGATGLGTATDTTCTRSSASAVCEWADIDDSEVVASRWHELIISRDPDHASDNYESAFTLLALQLLIPVDNSTAPDVP